jgi:hypothetical protein
MLVGHVFTSSYRDLATTKTSSFLIKSMNLGMAIMQALHTCFLDVLCSALALSYLLLRNQAVKKETEFGV